MIFHVGHVAAVSSDAGVSEAAARKAHKAGKWVSVHLVVDGKARIVFEAPKDLEVRFFDEHRRLTRHRRFTRIEGAKLLLDWAEENEYDARYNAVVRTRSWRLFSTGEILIDASDYERRLHGTARLERQQMSPFITAEPAFGDYAQLLGFEPRLPDPTLKWRETGM